MQTTISRRIAQTTAEDLARLATQGERKGIRILVDHRTGQHVATSASDPTRCYVVDAERGCTCKGYGAWQRCMHHSLLLAELGQLEPAPAPVLVCPACGGRGIDPECHGHQVAGGYSVHCPCYRCQGAGTTAPANTEQPARLAA